MIVSKPAQFTKHTFVSSPAKPGHCLVLPEARKLEPAAGRGAASQRVRDEVPQELRDRHAASCGDQGFCRQREGALLAVAPSAGTGLSAFSDSPGSLKKCHCKRGASYCVTVSKHFYCMKVQLVVQKSVTLRGELLTVSL